MLKEAVAYLTAQRDMETYNCERSEYTPEFKKLGEPQGKNKLPRERPIGNSVFRLKVELDGRALTQQIQAMVSAPRAETFKNSFMFRMCLHTLKHSCSEYISTPFRQGIT